MSDVNELLADIDKRLAIVEVDIERMAGMRKMLLGMSLFLLVQAGGIAYGWGQTIERLDNISLDELGTNVATALSVLGSHGNEIELIREEQHRIRGQVDSIQARVDLRTRDRYYKSDGDKLEERVRHLELTQYKNHKAGD
jgi:hypothetical protein